ncbi:MAG TPA: polysaccharide biosynthesis/export family protein [Candidatus Eisenbacteria bacterium]|nr:polysaccharide biosynthesis/export family protein [Candidatus Eisenbacteria bacterium]
MERLVRLWRERQNPSAQADPPIGPGDVLEVSVPAIEELKVRLVRVSGDGTIALPYIGKLHAAGMTEEQLQDKMVEALHKYMYNPRVSLFVREYRSRQVAVLGAVLKPGLYSVNTGADTILDMISQAGGITSGADPRLYFIPAEEADAADVQKITSTLPQNLMQDPSVMILKKTDPILIDLQELAMGGYQQYLSTSVRPGDVIMVPGGGQVLVEGWVEKPGAYNVTQGLTVSGAVVAAGGPLYPADVTAVKVIRSEKGGKRSFHTVDLEKIKRGEAPDVALKGGDIVEVAASSSKLIPYGLYRFFSTVVNVGIGGTIPFSGS